MDAWFATLSNLPEPSAAEVDRSAEEARPLEKGRAAMQAIAKCLEDAGALVTHPVSEWEAYGWVFTIEEGPAAINCMLQWGDEWLLMCWADRSLGDRLRGRHYGEELGRASQRIGTAIASAFDVPVPQWRERA